MAASQESSYRVVTRGGTAEIVEKRSRFIAEVFPVHTPEEAEEYIAQVTKRTWDARHHCHAFVLGSGGAISRCSDNGEPAGTAGKPILEVLTGAGLTDTLIVVTRYFGGVLLGTGGLVRAYTEAAQAGLAASETGSMVLCVPLTLSLSYDLVGNVQYALRELDIAIGSEEYTDSVRYEIRVPIETLPRVRTALIERTDGRIGIEEGEEGYFLL